MELFIQKLPTQGWYVPRSPVDEQIVLNPVFRSCPPPTNSMPFLTKHLSCTVATTLAVWHLICKNGTNFFFLLHNFTEDSFLTQISVTSAYFFFFFLSLLSQELSPFHLKKAHYGFSLAYLNWQHHYFCSLEPLLSKINVTWTQALRYCDSQ